MNPRKSEASTNRCRRTSSRLFWTSIRIISISLESLLRRSVGAETLKLRFLQQEMRKLQSTQPSTTSAMELKWRLWAVFELRLHSLTFSLVF